MSTYLHTVVVIEVTEFLLVILKVIVKFKWEISIARFEALLKTFDFPIFLVYRLFQGIYVFSCPLEQLHLILPPKLQSVEGNISLLKDVFDIRFGIVCRNLRKIEVDLFLIENLTIHTEHQA